MSDTVIKVENLGKKYLIGHQAAKGPQHNALRDVWMEQVRSLIRKTGDMFHGRQIIQGDEVEEFWALKDLNFEIKRGEMWGVIGRNGAGKSTLLKILSRITEPTEGRIHIKGRVASLLEVGTGFHPELTGRENIFLNGAILGMTRGEIRKKFDEIVDFAGVEKFLDTPVKRYSSGMYVRLAFAVAAHLEPEILVVDEVLAVGDAQFQKKCLGKMQDVSTKEGRTVLFVSHNMGAVLSLCTRALSLSNGRIMQLGGTEEVVRNYLSSGNKFGNSGVFERSSDECKQVEILAVRVLDNIGQATGSIGHDSDWIIEVDYKISKDPGGLCLSIRLTDQLDVRIATLETAIRRDCQSVLGESQRIRFKIAGSQVVPRTLTLLLVLHIPNVAVYDQLELPSFVELFDEGSDFIQYHGKDVGVIMLKTKIENL
ncbi:polysaccharide ABC transporter ATP-binding protein [Kamptonema cortianum]|nr:polysaccharide ABC transporter ATP-binding protein [Oscillatoria laete-virens]MDK3159969.1 polysaccharide ABC transporter ATP-binding protein [Kamptonema cortianum]MDL5047190.1 polysaccharide ABC transporter ATP-binding protein [Oscillatoria amoena NRMC-F 0135]MDL5055478.1 polysaccharide ABC transporter ATP-binding protein [Oscillatoria laete-virens NRMC-F 0139]